MYICINDLITYKPKLYGSHTFSVAVWGTSRLMSASLQSFWLKILILAAQSTFHHDLPSLMWRIWWWVMDFVFPIPVWRRFVETLFKAWVPDVPRSRFVNFSLHNKGSSHRVTISVFGGHKEIAPKCGYNLCNNLWSLIFYIYDLTIQFHEAFISTAANKNLW